MATAVVIGGGVSGLASAYYIQRYLPKFTKVIVLESSKRVGGWINSTINPDGCVFEHGPRSLRPVNEQGRNTLELAKELGLTKHILPLLSSDDAAKNRYLYVQGKLCALPNSITSLFKKMPPFSEPLIKAVLLEPFHRKSKEPDESVHSFVSRRFGREAADIAIDAMCRGIFAGDCRNLSVQACFPPLHEMEQKHGSLIAGLLFGSKKSKPELSGIVRQAEESRWASWSLKYGLQQLTDTMADAITNTRKGEIRRGSKCLAIQPNNSGTVTIKTDSDSFNADLVISSVYSKDLALLLPSSMSDLKKELSTLSSVNVVVVNLEYKDDVLPVKGFGHLLPSSESGPLLGIVYDSCTFPEHGRKGRPDSTRLTVMMGGSWYNELLTNKGTLPPGAEIVQMASQAAAKHLGIRARPIRSLVTLQEECIPQYKIGHMNWVTNVEQKICQSKLPLKLVGASYRGPAINDCINNARKAIEAMKPS